MAAKKKKRGATPPPPVRKKPPRAAADAGPSKRQLERDAQRSAQRQGQLRRRVVTAGLVAGALVVAGGVFFLDRRGDSQLREVLTSGGCTVDKRADPARPTGQNHVPNPTFAVNPPAGGDHLAGVADSDVYSGNSVPDDGLLVHSLEHGYIVLWHAPDLPANQKQRLVAFAEQRDPDVIVTERADMPVPVSATAWGHRLLCPDVQPDALKRFFDEHVDNGPEDVPRT